MNWTYTGCNCSREIPRYIGIFCCCCCCCCCCCLIKKIFFSIFSLLLSLKLPHYSLITSQHSFSYIFMIFIQLGEKNCFSFSFFLFFVFLFFFFLLFFLFSFLSFLLLVFLSYFLLKSSNTPLLFLNFHFHLNITLQLKKEKKKEEREKPYF